MNEVWKIFLSMSFSGGLLILALLFGKRFLKDRISRQWQYYIWLVVIARLLFPFGPEISLLGKAIRRRIRRSPRRRLLSGSSLREAFQRAVLSQQ